jgi:peptide/nickel transport system ATP-binding protein
MVDLLNVSDLTLEYPSLGFSRIATDSVNLRIPGPGFKMGIVGESGSGKSSLALSILKLSAARLVSGEIRYGGKNIYDMDQKELRNYRWAEVSMIFQSAMNSLNPVKRVSDHITEVIMQHSDASKSEARNKTIELLSRMQIKEDRIDDYPHQFSGGMIQRVFIAMALALSPKVLIADEPTSALDVVVQKKILKLIRKEISDNSISLLFITHEIALLNGLVDEVAVMFAGEFVELGHLTNVFSHPLHPYTEMLMSSLLTLDTEYHKARTTQNSITSKKVWTKNQCKYAFTCPYVFERCKVEKPQLREIEKGWWVACHKY